MLVSLIPKPRLTCVMYYKRSSDLIIQNYSAFTEGFLFVFAVPPK